MPIKPLPDRVLVSNIQKGERKVGSIILPNDDGKQSGIRARWAQVHAVGEKITGVQEGDWILIDHGRWSRSVDVDDGDLTYKVWQVDWPTGVLCVSDEPLETFSGEQVVTAEPLKRV